jgi:sugar phosphate isomerase/epimerase
VIPVGGVGGAAYDGHVPRSPRVCLSTSSVYPEPTLRAFDLAGELGYDGIEVMVGMDAASADLASLERARDYYEMPVTSIHAPCLLLTTRTWGTDPWDKLDRSAEAALRLGADVVVVHPPFRWQRSYAAGFTEGIRRLTQTTGLVFAVENMYPWRGPAGTEVRAYAPTWDPSELDVDHLTLDLSHAATARQSSLDLVHDWGERLAHVHLTDGTSQAADEHLLPGQGEQQADLVLQSLAGRGFAGQVVVEVKTSTADTTAERTARLADALAFARTNLRVPADSPA